MPTNVCTVGASRAIREGFIGSQSRRRSLRGLSLAHRRGHGGKLSQLPLNIRFLRYTKSSVHVFSIGKVRIFLAIIPSCHVPATSARAECGAAGNVTYAPAQTIAPPAPDASPVRTSNVLGAGDVKEHGNREPTVNRLPLLATGHTNLRSS